MEADLSLDALIRSELEGKDKAIGAYDEMLWKIRTGYAAVLYGPVSYTHLDVYKRQLLFCSSVDRYLTTV